MPAAAAHGDLNFVGRGHHRTGAHRHLARWQTRPVVQRVDLVRRKALEQAFLDHDLSAAAALFRGLKNEVYGAVEIARLGEVAAAAEQHRRVAIMPAGVHTTIVLRAVRHIAELVHWQAVHVGAQPDRAPARTPAPLDDADYASLGETAVIFDAPGGKLLRNDVRGAFFMEAELGMRVQVTPDRL